MKTLISFLALAVMIFSVDNAQALRKDPPQSSGREKKPSPPTSEEKLLGSMAWTGLLVVQSPTEKNPPKVVMVLVPKDEADDPSKTGRTMLLLKPGTMQGIADKVFVFDIPEELKIPAHKVMVKEFGGETKVAVVVQLSTTCTVGFAAEKKADNIIPIETIEVLGHLYGINLDRVVLVLGECEKYIRKVPKPQP